VQTKRSKRERAYVKIDGIKHYCGKWNTPETVEKYQRWIAEWSVTKQTPVSSVAKKESVTVNMLVDAFLEWAEMYYVKNGRLTKSCPEIGACKEIHLNHFLTPPKTQKRRRLCV